MREAPSVEEAHRLYGSSLTILGVAWSGDDRTYADFIDEGGLTFPQIDDTIGSVYDRFGIPYQPAAVLLQPDGTVTTIRQAIDLATISELVTT
ncbi:MAG: hypothetical protein O3A28_02165 [Actinomycetota bacterium]|nr:hypothetical protein [Actinomycetota bacterium]MDA3006083.1 hypothetical protein [Actinomycetota bacterium]MDA3033817.1 hypothetical protein [Actinomycetota bacterium]